MPRTPWIIDISDPNASTLLRGLSDTFTVVDPRFPRNAHVPFVIHPVTRGGDGERLFSEVDLSEFVSGQVGVGVVDEAPTGGTFALSVNGNSTGLTALAYDVSAATLEAAIDAIVPVTVTKTSNSYFTVTVVATNTAITWTSSAAALSPPSTISISTVTAPAVGVQSVYVIELLQTPWAYTSTLTARATSVTAATVSSIDLTPNLITTTADHGLSAGDEVFFASTTTLPGGIVALRKYFVMSAGLTNDDFKVSETRDGSVLDITSGGSGTITVLTSRDGVSLEQIAPGSATSPARYRVAIDPAPVSGAFRFIHGETQQVKVSCQPNTAVAQKWSLTPLAATSFATGCYFDLPDDNDVVCRVWIDEDNAGASAPATPSGGRLLEITTIASTDSLLVVAGKIADALIADGDWTATVSSSGVITITAATAEVKTALTSAGTSGFTLTVTTSGSDGQLAGAGFVLDDQNGTVGVYGTVGGLPASAPAFAAACTRQLAVALTGGDNATDVAADLATAIDADSEFVATSSGGLITITDANAGTRAGTTTASAGYFSTTIARAGLVVVATIEHDSTATAFEDQLVDANDTQLWTVAKTDDFAWVLTRAVLGSVTAPTVEDDSLAFLVGLEGELTFDTEAMKQAHALSTSDTLDAVLEVKLEFEEDAGALRMVLQKPCSCPADLLNGDVTASPAFALFRHAAVAVNSGVSSVAVTFSPAFSGAPTKVLAGPLLKASPTDDDPPLVMHVESITASGCTVEFTGTTTDSYTLGVLAIA